VPSSEKKGHAEYPWISDTLHVLSPEELAILEEDEGEDGLEEYHTKLAQAFITLEETTLAGTFLIILLLLGVL